jgi:ABC-2 type transport system permease protein
MNKALNITIALFKNSLRNTGERKGYMSNLMGIFISGLVFGVMFVFFTLQSGPIMHLLGLTAEFLAMVFFAAQIVVLLFGTILMVSAMFFSKDAEFLLSLPVPPSTVFLAKLLYVYISELVLSGFMVLTSGVTYGIVCGFGPLYYILLIPAILLVPMIPLVLSSLISIPLVFVISFFKNKGALTVIILIALFGVGMYYYFKFFSNIGGSDGMAFPLEEYSRAIGYLLPDIALARIVTLTSEGYASDVLMVLLFSAGLLAVSTLVSIFTYKRGVSAQLEQTKVSSSGKIEYTENSVLKTLIVKDAKEIIGNPGLAFYCLFQLVIAPIIIVFYNSMFFKSMAEGADPWVGFSISVIMLFLLVIGMNYTALTTISREGKNFHIMKSLPLPLSVHLKAKLILADAITLAGIVISIATMLILIPQLIIDIALFFLFCVIFGIGYNRFLVFIDAKYPKLDWENIVMALKNSRNSLLSMGVCMLIGVVFFTGYLLINILAIDKVLFFTLFWAFFLILAIALNYFFTRLLYNNFEKLVNQIE